MFTKLVLSGGGSKGIAILGALTHIFESCDMKNITEYWGTSIGSLICVLLASGYTPYEIFHQFFIVEFETDKYNIKTISDHVIKLINKKFGYVPTFSQFYTLTNKHVHIHGTNIDKMCGVTFNVTNSPDMCIVKAVEISCSIPFIFDKILYNGDYYTDGSIVNDFPIDMADDGESDVLGIYIKYSSDNIGGEYFNWIYKMLYIPILELHKKRMESITSKCIVFELIVDNNGISDLFPNKNKKIELFSTGKKQAEEQLWTKYIFN
jgi:predicted acylesterase/phospholipase RssA